MLPGGEKFSGIKYFYSCFIMLIDFGLHLAFCCDEAIGTLKSGSSSNKLISNCMGVLLQAFYWDCPKLENKEFEWWGFVKEKVKELSDVGFTALWLPPACKAANGVSMGYDPYDFYD